MQRVFAAVCLYRHGGKRNLLTPWYHEVGAHLNNWEDGVRKLLRAIKRVGHFTCSEQVIDLLHSMAQ